MKSYVINLDRRSDRWVVVRDQLRRQSISVTRFTAIDNGWRGCRDSHLAVLELCKNEVAFAIYEDDVEFIEDVDYINEAMMQLPKDYDCLFLGASPQEPQEIYSDNLYRLKNAKTTHAIFWHTRKGGAVEYILAHKEEINKIDDYFCSDIFPRFNCFLIRPLVAVQRQTQSDTCGRSDVSQIVSNYKKYCL